MIRNIPRLTVFLGDDPKEKDPLEITKALHGDKLRWKNSEALENCMDATHKTKQMKASKPI